MTRLASILTEEAHKITVKLQYNGESLNPEFISAKLDALVMGMKPQRQAQVMTKDFYHWQSIIVCRLLRFLL
jgi:hypothetical protein